MLQLSGVSSGYHGVSVLKDINLDLSEGDFLILFGDDDAGKTTLLNILMGFNTAYHGKVTVFGIRPNNLKKEQRTWLRFVPDEIISDPGMTGAEYFRYARESVPDYNSGLQHSLCWNFDIALDSEMTSMTRQQNKLVQIIAAICANPKLLILDEPSNFLSVDIYRELLDYLKKWHSQGLSILMAVERYEDARGLGTRYAYLKSGRIIADKKIKAVGMQSKVVTVRGGNMEVLDRFLTQRIGQHGNRQTYLYKGDVKKLLAVLYKAKCEDLLVEELTLKEELEQDFSRWI